MRRFFKWGKKPAAQAEEAEAEPMKRDRGSRSGEDEEKAPSPGKKPSKDDEVDEVDEISDYSDEEERARRKEREDSRKRSPLAGLKKQASDGNTSAGGESDSDSDSDLGDLDDLDDVVDISEDQGLFVDKEREEREEIVRSNFDVLCQVPFFAQFPKEHQVQLFDELRVEHYKDGDLIVKQGDKGDRMYVIIAGEAVVWRVEKSGETRDITHLYSHDYFGELALVYGQDRNSNVSAVGNTTVMYLSKDCFEKFEKIRVYMIVQKIPLLSKLPNIEMQISIVRKLQPVIFEKGEVVVRQGDPGDAFYLISKGSAVVEEKTGEVSTHLYEGHTFGQMALLSGAPRLATVRAREQLICMKLMAEDFKELIEHEKEFNRLLTSDDQMIRRRRSKRDARKNRKAAGSFDSTGGRNMSHESLLTGGKGSAASVFNTGQDDGAGGHNRRSSLGSSSISSNSNSALHLKKQLIENTKVDKSSRGGHKVVNGFLLQKDIGRGTFGRVKLCVEEKTGEQFAIKIIDKSLINRNENISKHAPGLNEMRQEVAIMKRLRHPNIVNLVAVIDDPAAEHLYIVTEYCENGAIMNGLEDNKPLPEATARAYFRDVLLGLNYLHRMKVIHRDIKPMNLLLTKDFTVKIADFGAARIVVGDTKWISGVTGTPAFMAPELLVEDSEVYDGPAVDLWSCGATLFMMVTGLPPWMSDDEITLSKKVKKDELHFPEDWNKRNYSPHLKNLISQLLVKDPKERLTLEETMNHDWVTEEGSEELIDEFIPAIIPYLGSTTREEQEAAIDQLHPVHSLGAMSPSPMSPSSPDTGPLTPTSAGRRERRRQGRQSITEVDLDNLEDVVAVDESGGSDDDDDESEYSVNNQYDFHRMTNRPSQGMQRESERESSEEKNSTNYKSQGETNPSNLVKATKGKKVQWINCRYGVAKDQNKRAKMEDATCVIPKLIAAGKDRFLTSPPKSHICFFAAIYDGHGGDLVSNALKESLHRTIAAQEDFQFEDEESLKEAITRACVEFDRQMLQTAAAYLDEHSQKVSSGTARQGLVRTKGDRPDEDSLPTQYRKAGSTACMVFVSMAKKERSVTVGWVGDSRAVLCRGGEALPLSFDHKASNPEETDRIRRAGGTVDRKGRVDGTLAISRSFGDIMHVGLDISVLAEMRCVGHSPEDDEKIREGIVIPVPDVMTIHLESNDEFIIVASDGLWDVLSNEAAVNFVRQQLRMHEDVQLAAQALCEKAAERSVDNISIIVVGLR